MGTLSLQRSGFLIMLQYERSLGYGVTQMSTGSLLDKGLTDTNIKYFMIMLIFSLGKANLPTSHGCCHFSNGRR
jgi:hypothetical protein